MSTENNVSAAEILKEFKELWHRHGELFNPHVADPFAPWASDEWLKVRDEIKHRHGDIIKKYGLYKGEMSDELYEVQDALCDFSYMDTSPIKFPDGFTAIILSCFYRPSWRDYPTLVWVEGKHIKGALIVLRLEPIQIGTIFKSNNLNT